MIGEFFSWYVGALADFWGTTLRLGLPQIVLLVIILMWLRRSSCRKRCDESDGETSCWTWGARGGWGSCCCCRSQDGSECGQADAEAGCEAEVVEESAGAEEAEAGDS